MVRTYQFLAVLAFSATLLLPAHARAQDASDTAAVRSVIDRLFDAMRVADTAAMNALFAGDVELLSVQRREGSTMVSPTTIDAFLRSVAAARAQNPDVALDERIGRTTIEIDGDLASAWTEYEFWVNDNFSHCGANLFTMARLEGEWRILRIADSRRREGCDRD